MSVTIRRHVDVEQDIIDLAAWIARDSRDTALRFLDSVEETIGGLRGMPAKGSLKRFRDRLVYEVRPDHVYIFAIVHGRQNYLRKLKAQLQ